MDYESIPSGVRLQWSQVISKFNKEITLKENFLRYKPLHLKRSLVLYIDEWNIDTDKMRMKHRYSPNTEKLLWIVEQPDGVYLFNRKHIVCPDKTVLCFQ